MQFKTLILIMACISTGALCIEPPFLNYHNERAHEILNSLSRREKIGQLFMVTAASNFEQPTEYLADAMKNCACKLDPEHVEKMITDYNVGGVLFLFKSDPQKQVAFTKRFQAKAKIPLLIALDCENGLGMRLDMNKDAIVRYPYHMMLGALQNEDLVRALGNEIGKQCAILGAHINFAPVVDVNNNAENPIIHFRSFGDDKERVSRLGQMYARGLQDAGVIACLKHFPGHGDTDVDSHIDLPIIKHDIERLNAIELYPFKKLIQHGVGAVMTAHLSVPALDSTENMPSSLSYKIVTQELKNNCNFKGLVVTDALIMQGVTNYYKPGELELQAFLAGNDILLCPLDVPLAIDLIDDAIEKGTVDEADLNARVLKILQAKEWAFAQQEEFIQSIDNCETFLTRPQAYELQKQIYRNALTLAKGDITDMPEKLKNSGLILIGTMPQLSDNMRSAEYEPIIKNIVAYKSQLSLDDMHACLNNCESKESIIIALSDMNIDAKKKYGIADNTFALIRSLKEQGKHVKVIIFGTPYSLKYLSDADTILVAYENTQPAQEAVLEVLLGILKPQGRLPVKV